jgi:hypothetical protein
MPSDRDQDPAAGRRSVAGLFNVLAGISSAACGFLSRLLFDFKGTLATGESTKLSKWERSVGTYLAQPWMAKSAICKMIWQRLRDRAAVEIGLE